MQSLVTFLALLSVLHLNHVYSSDLLDKCQRYKPNDPDKDVKSWLLFFGDSQKPLLCIAGEGQLLYDEGCSQRVFELNGLEDCCSGGPVSGSQMETDTTDSSESVHGEQAIADRPIGQPNRTASPTKKSSECRESKSLSGDDINVVLIVVVLAIALFLVAICFVISYSTGLSKSSNTSGPEAVRQSSSKTSLRKPSESRTLADSTTVGQ